MTYVQSQGTREIGAPVEPTTTAGLAYKGNGKDSICWNCKMNSAYCYWMSQLRPYEGSEYITQLASDKYKDDIIREYEVHTMVRCPMFRLDAAAAKHEKRIKRPVVQIFNGNIVNQYQSAYAAAKVVGATASAILNCCNRTGYAKSCKGYKWAFAEDVR